jgi:hypothetical protein
LPDGGGRMTEIRGQMPEFRCQVRAGSVVV